MSLPYNSSTVESYLNDIKIYQSKIEDGSITDTERQEVRTIIGNYYQYLAATGIKYGDAAYDVSQNQGGFGEFANKHLETAAIAQGKDPSTIDTLKSDFMVSLAIKDAETRKESGGVDGVISYNSIAQIHYNVLESDDFDLDKSAWGGHFFEEFIGSGSWMEFGGYDYEVDIAAGFANNYMSENAESVGGISAWSSFATLLDSAEEVGYFDTFNTFVSGTVSGRIVNSFANLSDGLLEFDRDHNDIIVNSANILKESFEGFKGFFDIAGDVKGEYQDFYNKFTDDVNLRTYTIKENDTISQIANSLGITTELILQHNPWIESENRISEDGSYILIKPEENLVIPASDITNSTNLENVTVKDQSGYEVGTYTNFLIDQSESLIISNQENNSWETQSLDGFQNLTLEIDFDALLNQVLGLEDKNWNGIDLINNDLLTLTINTDLTSGFRDGMDLTQEGNVIDGGDYQISGPIENVNGDGIVNVAPWGIVSDFYRPGNVELSDYANFSTDLQSSFSAIDDIANDPFGLDFDLQLRNPLADISNVSIDARDFLNIDPLVLDLDGDGVNLISYEDSQVVFDVDNDQMAERTGWFSGQDGILAHDKDGDGVINDITETISEYYNPEDGSVADDEGKYSIDGLDALKKLDSNDDDIFNNQDDAWDDLMVWQDVNEDGVTDAEELKTLSEVGVLSIDLDRQEAYKERDEGNVILSRSTYTTVNSEVREVAAVDFTTNPMGYEFNDVNLGKLATAEDGTKSLVISNKDGEVVIASDETAQNIFGNLGDDDITGDERDNWLSGGAGSDILRGEAGDDIIIIDEEDLQENIDGGEGRDVVIINSDSGVSFNLTAANVETAVGGNGDDVLIGGGTSNIFVDGGNGDDIIIGGAADDALSGSSGSDYIDGGYGNDILRGHRDEDVLIGGEGDDYIDGGLQDDKLFGGVGKDILIGGKGNDEIDGGDGYDLAKYEGSYANYTVSRDGDDYIVEDLNTGDIDSLTNIEGIRFDDITMGVDASNIAPMSVADSFVLPDRNAIFISKDQLLANDTDIDGDDILILSVQNAVGGTINLVQTGDVIDGIEFTPDDNYFGLMSFDYSIQDTNGASTQITQYNNDGTSQVAAMRSRVELKFADDPNDPLYIKQWYLSEINIRKVWDDYTGEGVKIGVFEEGDFNRNHEDLDDNIIDEHKLDQEFRQVEQFAQHATTVAGVIAAERNDYGIVGVAYNADLDGYSWDGDETGLENLKYMDVANNSWGTTIKFADNFSDSENTYYEHQNHIEDAVKEGREGLGTITVFAGGNQREEGDNVNYHNLQNSRFVITTGSINQPGDLGTLTQASTPFSNPGASILVSAPGSNIQSTGNLLENENGSTFLGEFASSQGTSFSAPIVSGVAALMLEANPNLGYRDVQIILALSARQFEDENTIWQENGAENWNGGAMHFSHDYGYGIVDTLAAVRLAETWDEVNNFYNEGNYSIQDGENLNILDNSVVQKDFIISDSNLHNIETVEVWLDITHNSVSDLKITLISPSGTTSELMVNPEDIFYSGGIYFNFSSKAFFGEKVDGQWQVLIEDYQTGQEGILHNIELNFFGKLDDGTDDTYVYTNEFVEFTDGNRAIVSDNDGGEDSINAVAVYGDSIVNLNAGEISNIAGRDLTISSSDYSDEYYQRLDELPIKQAELSAKETELQGQQYSLQQLQDENSAIGGLISQKLNEYYVKVDEYNAAIADFESKKEWFDNHTYLATYGTQHFYEVNATGATISIQDSELNQKIDAYNSALNTAIETETELNQSANEYNELLSRAGELPTLIDNLENDISATSDEVTVLQSEVNFIEAYILSFNEGDDPSIIENAYLGDGNDILIGNDIDNKLYAGRGDNTLTGNGGDDIFMIKQDSNTSDIITDFAVGEDKVDLSDFDISFSDISILQEGLDTIVEMSSGQRIILQNILLDQISESGFIFSQGQSDYKIYGTEFDDVIDGDDQNQWIESGLGNDIVKSFAGDDYIYGDKGDDQLYGGAGEDTIYGGEGDDFIYGDGDSIEGVIYSYNDKLFGGLGDDIIHGGFGENEISLGDGWDKYIVSRGSETIDIISDFNPNFDVIDLSAINDNPFDKISDFFDLDMTQEGSDVIIDLYAIGQVFSGDDFYDLNIDQTIILEDVYIKNISGSNFIGITDLANSTEDMVVSSEGFGDRILTGFGNDIITAGVFGNIIYSGGGDDLIYLTYSDNVVTTGDGQDIVQISSEISGDDIIKDFDASNDKVDLSEISGIENVGFEDLSLLQDGNNVILSDISSSVFASRNLILENVNLEDLSAENFIGIYDGSDDPIDGNEGDDVIEGSSEDDIINGGDGNDIIYGNEGNDILNGGIGRDRLDGGSGDDIINGGDGDDEIYGWYGNNIMSGGLGGDIFNINGNKGGDYHDVITDFDIDSGDQIALSGNLHITKYDDLNIYDENGNAVIEFLDNQKLILENVDAALINDGYFSNFRDEYIINGSKFDDDMFGYFSVHPAYGSEYEIIIHGGEGNDNIQGHWNGNNVIFGDEGDDVIEISHSIDNILTGGEGSDRFIFGESTESMDSHFGNIITDFDFDDPNEKLVFDGLANVHSMADLIIEDSDDGVVIGYDSRPSWYSSPNIINITLQGGSVSQLNESNFEFRGLVQGTSGIDSIVISDGLSYYVDGKEGDDSIITGSGDDHIYDYYDFGSDVVDAGAGDDYIGYTYGNDIIYAGSGNDEINSSYYWGDYSEEIANAAMYGGSGEDLIHIHNSYYQFNIDAGDDNDTILLSANNSVADGGDGDDLIMLFSTPLSFYLYPEAAIPDNLNNEIRGGLGDDIISVFNGDSNILHGGQGSDKFIIEGYDGETNIIADFEINNPNEKIDIQMMGVVSLSDLEIIQDGTDTVINIDDIQTVILRDVDSSQLSEDNFLFMTQGSENNDIIYLSDDNDVVDAGAGDDTIYSKDGLWDVLYGGEGSDKFVIEKNEGLETYILDFEYDNPDEKIVIKGFEDIVSFADITISYDAYYSGYEGIDPIERDYNDQYNEGYSAYINLGDGQFLVLQGFEGWSLSEDNFVIQNNSEPESTSGILSKAVRHDSSFNFLFPSEVFYDVDGDLLTLTAKLSDGSDLPSWLVFDSNNKSFYGTPPADLTEDSLSLLITASDGYFSVDKEFNLNFVSDIREGTADNNSLTGTDSHDIIDGGRGNDNLHGGLGNDTYRYSSRDGLDVIYESSIENENGGDMIEFESGISQDHLQFVRRGDDLVINFKHGDSDRIIINNQFSLEIGKVENLSFSDGTILAISDIEFSVENQFIKGTVGQDVLDGGAGDDVIHAYDGNDILNGNDGSDVMKGHGGDDILNGGLGDDLINGNIGNDILYGNEGNDDLKGGQGDDILYGGDGDDILRGLKGSDILFGGQGNDMFDFSKFNHSEINSPDLISDFTQGEDMINVSSLGFTDIVNGTESGNESILTYHFDGDETVINNDNDIFEVRLTGNIDLVSDDFYFG